MGVRLGGQYTESGKPVRGMGWRGMAAIHPEARGGRLTVGASRLGGFFGIEEVGGDRRPGIGEDLGIEGSL